MNPARLLLIEDDPALPVVLRLWLEKHSSAKLMIDHAPTMELGMERAPGAAAILLDLSFPPDWPKERTVKAIALLREHAPVIVLTGHSLGADDADAAFASDLITEHGADSVIFKTEIFNATSANVGWMFNCIQAAIGRRLYQEKIAKAAQAE